MATGNMGIKKKDLDDSNSEGPSAVIMGMGGKSDDDLKYPSFTLTNKHIEAAGLSDAQAGDTVTFTVKAHVSSTSKKAPGSKSYEDNRVSLDVQDISDVSVTPSEEAEDSDEDKETTKAIGFSPKSIKSGGGSMGPKAAGLKL